VEGVEADDSRDTRSSLKEKSMKKTIITAVVSLGIVAGIVVMVHAVDLVGVIRSMHGH